MSRDTSVLILLALVAGCADDSEEHTATSAQAEEAAATVSTDKFDYSPGETALLAGVGWAPNEDVVLSIACTCGCNDQLHATTDAAGTFADAQYPIQEEHLGAECNVTAVGQSSGLVAQTVFTDGNVRAVTVDGTSYDLTFALYATTNCTGAVVIQGGQPKQGTDHVTSTTPSQIAAQPGQSVLFTAAANSIEGGAFTSWLLANTGTSTSKSLCIPGFSGTQQTYQARYAAPPPSNHPPVVTCANVSNTTAPNSCTLNTSVIASKSDPDGDAVTCTESPGAPYHLGTTSVTVSCSDGKGGTASCTGTVTLSDDDAPAVTCAPAQTVECTSPQGAAATLSASANDNCNGAVTASCPGSGNVFALGTTSTQCTARDAAGNTGACTTTVTVVDTTRPMIACPAPVTAECTGHSAAAVDVVAPAASDLCGAVSVSDPAAASYPLGTTTVAETATDGSGNTSSCTTAVTVVDTLAPTISCPAPVTAECTGKHSATVDPGVAQASDVCGDVTVTAPGAAAFPLGTTTVSETATDAVGNAASCTTAVTVHDTLPPTISCPAAVTAECTGNNTATVDVAAAIASDVCGGASVTDPAAQAYPLGTTTVTETATDEVGLSASCTTTVTVADTTKPTISCPAPITAECTGHSAATVDVAAATASDACSTVSVSDPAAASYPLGTTTVSETATDTSGNANSCTSTVTVVDTTPPAISCPAPVTAECTGNHSAFVDPGTAVASDVCGAVSVHGAGAGAYPLGTTTITDSATDAVGLAAVCTSSVTVTDTTAPAISCPAPVTVECTGNNSATVDVAAATASDVCGGTSVTDPAAMSYPLGTTTVAETATDDVGNATSCSTTVTVADTTAPTITCPAPITVECTANGQATVDVPAGTAADVCGAVSVTDPASASYPLGTTTVSETATDGSGLATSCTSSVTVRDTTAPTFASVPAPQTLVGDCGGAALAFTKPTAVDGCQTATVTCAALPANSFGTNTINCTATDPSGNTATTQISVTVLQPLRVVFASPLADDNIADDIANDADIANVFQVKSTIPHQVSLYSCSGTDVTTTVPVTVKITVTLRDGASGAADTNLVPVATGVGDSGGVMALVDGKYKYNLKTTGYQTGTAASSLYFDSVVRVSYTSAPSLTAGVEDVRLESK